MAGVSRSVAATVTAALSPRGRQSVRVRVEREIESERVSGPTRSLRDELVRFDQVG
jgi:hypothetical protein